MLNIHIICISPIVLFLIRREYYRYDEYGCYDYTYCATVKIISMAHLITVTNVMVTITITNMFINLITLSATVDTDVVIKINIVIIIF